MEQYNPVFLQQLAPLIKLWVCPDVDGEVSKLLLKYFLSYDISGKKWNNSIIRNWMPAVKYMIHHVESQDLSSLDKYVKSSDNEHSKLSPFNVDSDLFPNGILSCKWLEKYVDNLPFTFVAVYKLTQIENDTDLASKIIGFKRSLAKYGVALSVIIVSDSEDPKADDARIVELRRLTQLPRHNGLLYLNTSPETMIRDTEVLVASLLSNLKTVANEFYGAKDSKLQDRGKKYYSCPSTSSINTRIEITPLFLETRNLLKQAFLTEFFVSTNLEPSIKLLEIAYNNLTEILIESFDGKLIPNYDLSEHDTKVYFQFRNLLDIIAFHIVRGYFSLEDPLQALKKHGAHVSIVSNMASSIHNSMDSTNYWQALQYEWLAELMELIPSSISVEKKLPKFKRKPTLGYYGGIKIIDRLSYEVFTEPSLNYLHAYSLLTQPLKIDSRSYLATGAEVDSIGEHRISLLQSCIRTYLLQKDEIDTFISYLYWLIGEEYYTSSKEEAIKFYEKSLTFMNDNNLQNLILQKLLICYEQTDKSQILRKLIQLDLSLGKPLKTYPDIDLDNVNDESITHNIFNIDSLLINPKLDNDCFLYETCTLQLYITPILHIARLQNYLPKAVILLSIESIKVQFRKLETSDESTFSNVLLTHDPSLNDAEFNSVSLKEEDNLMKGSLNLTFSNKDKIIELSQIAKKVGTYKIDSIEIESILKVSQEGKDVILKCKQIQIPEENRGKTALIFYISEEDEDEGIAKIRKKWIRMNKDANSIVIKPVKPNILIELTSIIENVIMGEKVSIPVSVNFEHPKHRKIDYKQILLSPQIRVISESQQEPDLQTQISWDLQKDDESLNLEHLVKADGGTETHNLNILVNRPPSKTAQVDKYTVTIDIKTIVKEVNEDDMIAVYEVFTTNYPIINELFEPKLLISPRFDKDESVYMPSPFIVPEGADEQSLILPIPVRLWLANVYVTTSLSDIDILNVDFVIKPSNSELSLELIGNVQKSSTNYNQLFTTKSKNGYSHRTVNVLTVVNITWKRKDSNSEQVFTSEEWEIILPLSDPRVLLTVVQEEDSRVNLQYILENPTPRIFNFTSQLLVESPETNSLWNFEDKRNIVPFKHNSFPVLPFSRHIIEFYGKYNNKGQQYLQLPTFKVFDVNFKVGLPTLSVDESVVIKNGVLYLKREIESQAGEKANLL